MKYYRLLFISHIYVSRIDESKVIEIGRLCSNSFIYIKFLLPIKLQQFCLKYFSEKYPKLYHNFDFIFLNDLSIYHTFKVTVYSFN